MNEYDVVIRMSEPRYWVLLAGSLLAGWALIRRFQSIDEVVKDRALKLSLEGFVVAPSGVSGVDVV